MSAVFFSTSCSYMELEGDETIGNGSVLASLIGDNLILPPDSLNSVIVNNLSDYKVRLTWPAQEGAKSYLVFVGESETGVAAESNFLEYPVIVVSGSSQTILFSVAAVNISGVAGAKSISYSVVISSDGVFDASVEQAFASKGTESGIMVSWTPVPAAAYYRIERVAYDRNRVGEPAEDDFVVVRSSFFPIGTGVTMIEYLDTYVSATAQLFDYFITPFNSEGAAGTRTLYSEDNVAREGYIRPFPDDIQVISGLWDGAAVVGSPSSGDNESVIELQWSIKSKLFDNNGILENPAEDPLRYEVSQIPSSFNIQTAYSPVDANFKSVSSVFLEEDGELFALVSISGKFYEETALPVGLTEDSDSGVKLWFEEIDGVRYYRYRIAVQDNDFTPGNQNYLTSWGQKFYFRIQVRYNENSLENRYISPFSLAQGGIAVNPDSVVFQNGEVLAVVGVSFLDPLVDAINVSWPAVTGAGGYFIYRKGDGEGAYKCLTPNGVTELIYDDIEFDVGSRYQYAIAVSDDLELTHHGALSQPSAELWVQ